jgi:predicted site-specific integrase-resolvase
VRNYSTAQAARILGIGRQTLHRWIASGAVAPPRLTNVAGVKVRIWTNRELELARKYKKQNYRKGRGRKPKAARGLKGKMLP